ncbi:5'-AMP-activated protein kinase beta subunit, interation domain-containing protein [Ephemerocybe angulata]|uniref:5'-AMP-activated protein kinase beta subunit, interation domain-containing protein n=1 Tax=Ephemerocybe angulata TaxID=980116 RepID=A0A8H6HK31_9AGAR|nr:5'-AMP-activated protein kinase beta subunit, interation domain-containing protein [Tulosesus angulatus]
MGNSASNPGNGGQRLQHQRRNHSPSPSPGAPHRSLRTKKNSLQLPDLASLTGTQPSSTPKTKTQSIPIPTTANVDPQRERGRVVPQPFSSTDLLDSQPYNNHNHHTTNTGTVTATRGTPYYRTQQQQQAQQRKVQELYANAAVPISPPDAHRPPGSPAFVQEVVRSSIPVALQPKPRILGEDGRSILLPKPDPVPVRIVWRGGGHNVLLARAGDDEWKGRRQMERENAGSPIFETTVLLLPGTHHIRFLVDDQWRVADDLPTAVDDQGSLANYVAVPFTNPSPSTGTKGKDPSFFAEGSGPAAVVAAAAAATSSPPPQRTGPNPAQQAQWTNVLPPELLEAFKEEEMYLAANQGNTDQSQHHTRVSGFVPAPNIPPAPALPRHLDKLILNQRLTPGPAMGSVGNVGPVGNAASVVPSGTSGAVGSGQGSGGRSGRRERTREERREERRRGRERGYSDVTGSGATPTRRMPPPPPPPSEVGEVDPAAVEAAIEREGAGSAGTVNPATWAESSASETPSGATSTAATTPATPSTPIPGAAATAAAQLVASRALTIDPTNMPPLTDDASVLAVPSHVVLHHLCTSAIRNGVLAVATTTRYRQKYLTTIFYKPT